MTLTSQWFDENQDAVAWLLFCRLKDDFSWHDFIMKLLGVKRKKHEPK
jgi:hypothetical protein